MMAENGALGNHFEAMQVGVEGLKGGRRVCVCVCSEVKLNRN